MSKQAIAGTSGSCSETACSAASDFGWCSGARSVSCSSARGDLVVDQHRAGEPLAAVDDPVHDRLGVIETVAQRRLELRRIDLRARSLELTLGEDPVVVGDQAELERARAGVDGEDRHAALSQLTSGAAGGGAPVQVQSRTSGGSSPNSRVYARACSRASCICWRRPAARSPRSGTRSITSITR